MNVISAILAVICITLYGCSNVEAKPRTGDYKSARRTTNQKFIIGGEEAVPGAWPWQLSFQYFNGQAWSHFCGAVLLSSRNALTAAHCVDGIFGFYQLRVVAGLHDRRESDSVGVRSNVAQAKMHERYDDVEFYNDIATLGLEHPVSANGLDIGYATLPENDLNNFSASTCVLTGWGREDHNPNSPLPFLLKQVNIGILTTTKCNSIFAQLNGISVTPSMICAYDNYQETGSCNGDSGGPMNCPTSRGYVVAGITSWGIGSENYSCYTEFPSVYTRTSSYLAWISANLPFQNDA